MKALRVKNQNHQNKLKKRKLHGKHVARTSLLQQKAASAIDQIDLKINEIENES